jgi:chromosome segregation ATPase
MAAVSKALEFLSSDEAHALFSNTFSASFLQASSERRMESQRRAAVMRTLQKAAMKSHDPRLSTLQIRARSDQFASLKKTIKTMVDRLNKEKKDEVKQRDFCIEQFNKNEKDTAFSNQEKADTDAKITAFKAALATLTQEIDALKAEMAELSKQLKQAGEDREKANKDFQVTISDQRATQKLLTTALGILKGFYEKGALVQTTTYYRYGQAPPVAFKSYSKNKSSGA